MITFYNDDGVVQMEKRDIGNLLIFMALTAFALAWAIDIASFNITELTVKNVKNLRWLSLILVIAGFAFILSEIDLRYKESVHPDFREGSEIDIKIRIECPRCGEEHYFEEWIWDKIIVCKHCGQGFRMKPKRTALFYHFW